MQPVPALIVSGFLGSGKTTLVGHLLKQAQAEGARLAIVSNEFGDTGIDKALLEAGEEGFVELDGGCVCCRLSDALGETLQTIVEQVGPDRIVIECSGVALPGDVLVQFWRAPIDAVVVRAGRLDVGVVLVDADTFARTSEGAEDDTFLQQVEAADLLLLNKCDLADEDTLQRCEMRLGKLSGGRPVLRAVQAAVDPRLLFPPDPEGSRLERRDPEAHPAPHVHEQFNTTELRFEGIVDGDVLRADLVARGALRAKGFVRTAAGVRLVQGGGERSTPERSRLQPRSEQRAAIWAAWLCRV